MKTTKQHELFSVSSSSRSTYFHPKNSNSLKVVFFIIIFSEKEFIDNKIIVIDCWGIKDG